MAIKLSFLFNKILFGLYLNIIGFPSTKFLNENILINPFSLHKYKLLFSISIDSIIISIFFLSYLFSNFMSNLIKKIIIIKNINEVTPLKLVLENPKLKEKDYFS